MNFNFPAKIVLAGEHAVLRGYPAVALQVPEFSLSLGWNQSQGDESLICSSERLASDLRAWETVFNEHGEPVRFKGRFSLTSKIPTASGLGSSAALCAAIASVAAEVRGVDPAQRAEWIQNWAQILENRFHGTSSGMDVAAVLASGPIEFLRERGPRALRVVATLPRISLHDTGLRSSTKACVEKVANMSRSDLEQEMGEASRQVVRAIESGDREELFRGVNRAQTVMQHWSLVPSEAEALIAELKARGARALKLTGAGLGGFVVALWD